MTTQAALDAMAVRIGTEAGRRAAAWRLFTRAAGVYPRPPAYRSGSTADAAWVEAQLAKRVAYIAAIAEKLGLDPAEATRRWRAGELAFNPVTRR